MSDRLRDVLKILLAMSNGEIRELYRYLGRHVSEAKDLQDIYVAVMNDIIGEDIRVRSRRHDVVWGRYIVISALLERGWSNTAAGRVFGLDHSSVTHARGQVDNMLAMPVMYGPEYRVYREFLKRISDEDLYLAGKAGGASV